MRTIRVGVIRGGRNSDNYQKSISNGAIILRALREHDDYTGHDILIDKDEVWHLDGVPIVQANLINKIDICISTTDDILEKSGSLSKILKSLGIKHVYPSKESLRGYIPDSLKEQIKSVGVRTPKQLDLDFNDTNLAGQIHKTFSPPYSLIKVDSTGIVSHITHSKNIDELFEVLEKQELDSNQKYILEEYINGEEWAVNIIPNFRDTKFYTLHPVYLNTVNPAFKSNVQISRSAEGRFATPHVHGTLDLYGKLVA